MFALTTIIKSPAGSYQVYDGVLFRIPAELSHAGRVKEYLEGNKIGWWNDRLGYSGYSKYDFEGNLVIVPGLIINDSSVKRKRLVGYSHSFSRAQVEDYVQGLIEFEKRALEHATEDVNMLIHDLRRISGAIYNTALEAEQLLNDGNAYEARVRIQNVQATQQILKIRTDVLDFTGNPASIVDRRPIDIFRRVDKVCRIFKPSGQKKKIEILLEGSSFEQSLGPEIFEIVPYVLLDNAIKYSPDGSAIRVEVQDGANEIVLAVDSFGPHIMPHELTAIFEKGYRGKSAQAVSAGSGIGLYLMREIVDKHFGGSISAEQNVQDSINVNSQRYFRTKFVVSLPVIGG